MRRVDACCVLGVLVACTVLSVAVSQFDGSGGCYNQTQNPYLYFGSKTAYDQVYGQKNENIRGCQPVQIWMLIRHGTRYPDAEEIHEMLNMRSFRDQIVRNREAEHRGQMCYPDIQNWKSWDFNLVPGQANMLTKQGRDDMNYLALRLRTRYPQLLQQTYSPELFQFRHTKEDRTRESASIFAESLFGNRGGINFIPPPDNDTLLRANKHCPGWERDILRSNDTDKEWNLFWEGREMQSLIREVSERLGFRYQLTAKQIKLMYDMCRYNKAWRRELVSPWCAAFTTQELMVLEYSEDLKYYYRYGYGNEHNQKLACPLVKDLIENFRKLEDENNSGGGRKPAGIFYFSHESMLSMLLTALDIARDPQPLKHDNYHEMQKRQWRVSLNGPFAGNLAAVFYRCNNNQERYQMTFLTSERLVDYKECSVGLCSWEHIKQKFAKMVNECNLDICLKGLSGGDRARQHWFTVSVVPVLLVFYYQLT